MLAKVGALGERHLGRDVILDLLPLELGVCQGRLRWLLEVQGVSSEWSELRGLLMVLPAP